MSLFKKNISPALIEKVDRAVMTHMAEQGLRFVSESALNVFKNHGFKVDGQIVRFDEGQVRSAIEQAPPQFTIKGRDRKFDLTVGGGSPVYCPAYGPVFVSEANEKRPGTLQDLINFVKLVETSSVVNIQTPFVIAPMDVPGHQVLKHQMATVMQYAAKPTMCVSGDYITAKEAVNLIKKLRQSSATDYVTIGLASALSPLSFDEAMAGVIMAMAEENQPLIVGCGALPGVTTPVTVMGAVIGTTAEMLGGLTLAQLIRPGLPVVMGNVTASTDLRFVTPSIGSPEAGQIAAISKAMCEYYRLPCRGGGCLSDAKETDYEAGSESALVMMATLAAGVDFIIHACGIMDSFNIIGYEKFILDEQTIAFVNRLLDPPQLDDESLAAEAICQAGHKGQFLTLDHTKRNFRNKLFVPLLSLHGHYDLWKKNGRRSLMDQAAEAVKKRLNSYQPLDFDQEAATTIQKYLG